MVDFGAVRSKLRSPKLSKLWAILATISAAICYTTFTSNTGGPGTTPTYERTLSVILGTILVPIHTTILISNRDTLVSWFRNPNSFILTLLNMFWSSITLLITTVITFFLFKFPYFQVNDYTLWSAFAFAADVVFLEMWAAPEGINWKISLGWWVYGCLTTILFMLTTEPKCREPGYEGYHCLWFSILTYFTYMQLVS